MPLESCKVALACINCNSFPSFISGWQNIITFFNYKHGFLQMATTQVKYSFYTLRSSVEPHHEYNETKEYIRKSSRTQPRKTSTSPTWKKTLHSHHKDNTSTTHQQHNHDTSTTHQHIPTTVTSSTATHPLHINNTTASHDQHNHCSTTQQPPSQLSTTLITTLTTDQHSRPHREYKYNRNTSLLTTTTCTSSNKTSTSHQRGRSTLSGERQV